MRQPRPGQGQGPYYLVLNRSCADLYQEIADCFEDRLCIEVVVDRRRGQDRMAEIPASQDAPVRMGKWRAKQRLMSVRLRQQD